VVSLTLGSLCPWEIIRAGVEIDLLGQVAGLDEMAKRKHHVLAENGNLVFHPVRLSSSYIE
jgi:hypothetical protein